MVSKIEKKKSRRVMRRTNNDYINSMGIFYITFLTCFTDEEKEEIIRNNQAGDIYLACLNAIEHQDENQDDSSTTLQSITLQRIFGPPFSTIKF